MLTKSYRTEEGRDVDLSHLRASSGTDFAVAHQSLVTARYEVIIEYQRAKLLFRRSSSPGQGLYLPIGGEMERGVEIEESLRERVRDACNLTLENITELGTARTVWKDDPFGHGKGTDALIWVYSAEGQGELPIDARDQFQLIDLDEYGSTRPTLIPYTRDCLDAVIYERKNDLMGAYIEPGMELQRAHADPLPREEYEQAHRNGVIACHDVFILYQGGILLLNRNNFPAKDILWPVGGRIERGLRMEESLRRKAKAECNLELEGIEKMGTARKYWATDPFGHGHGTDDITQFHFARGRGELQLDRLHKDPILVTPLTYTQEFQAQLHPCVRDFLKEVMRKLI